jgi:hypothetical protein
MAAALAALRWDWPWMAPYAPYAQAAAAGLQSGLSVAQVLNQLGGTQAPVRFVPESQLPAGQAYEAYIAEQQQCPTRDNLHDLFNGLTWLALPRTKARLNVLQAGEIARAGVGDRRGPLRDALTLFDENGALLQAPPALWQALEERDWQRLFVDLRGLWAQARLVLFGHALQEKLQQPRKAITAHVYRPQRPLDLTRPRWDEALAADLSASYLAEKPYCPLPILGVPGWHLPNENVSFYDDAHVFRPPATGRKSGALDN